MKYREALGLIKIAEVANGWDYRNAAEQAKSGTTPQWSNNNLWGPQQQLNQQRQLEARHPNEMRQMAQQRAQGTFDAINGGAVEFAKELPGSVANAGRGIMRGAVNMIPGAVATAVNLPYTMQRVGEIATGKYQNYDGFMNKWRASKEQGEDSWAKNMAEGANDFMGGLNNLEDKVGLAYDEDYPEWARTTSESVGAFMGGMGLSAASSASPVLGAKPSGGIQLTKAAPGATPATPAANQSTGAWKAMDQVKRTYNSIPKSTTDVGKTVLHAGINKFAPVKYQQPLNNVVDAGYTAYGYIKPALGGGGPVQAQVQQPQPAATVRTTQTAPDMSYEQYAANWNNQYGDSYGF